MDAARASPKEMAQDGAGRGARENRWPQAIFARNYEGVAIVSWPDPSCLPACLPACLRHYCVRCMHTFTDDTNIHAHTLHTWTGATSGRGSRGAGQVADGLMSCEHWLV